MNKSPAARSAARSAGAVVVMSTGATGAESTPRNLSATVLITLSVSVVSRRLSTVPHPSSPSRRFDIIAKGNAVGRRLARVVEQHQSRDDDRGEQGDEGRDQCP